MTDGTAITFGAGENDDVSQTTLSINILGRVHPQIINFKTLYGQVGHLNNTKNEAALDFASVAITNPEDGTYTVSLESPYMEDYELSIFYAIYENVKSARINGYYDGILKEFTFSVNQSSDSPITGFNRAFSMPTSLVVQNVSGFAGLFWNDSHTGDVDHYEILCEADKQPSFSLLGSTVGAETSYITNQLWTEALENQYMVRALLRDGTSTFCSNIAFFTDEEEYSITQEEEYSMTQEEEYPITQMEESTNNLPWILGASLGGAAIAVLASGLAIYAKVKGIGCFGNARGGMLDTVLIGNEMSETPHHP